MVALSYVLARLSAAVPPAWFAKSKVRVSHVFATVVVASVSTVIVLSAWFSTLSRTGMPAAGAYTRTVIVVAPVANGTLVLKPSIALAVSVVPA